MRQVKSGFKKLYLKLEPKRNKKKTTNCEIIHLAINYYRAQIPRAAASNCHDSSADYFLNH